MSNSKQQLADSLRSKFADKLSSVKYEFREITVVVTVDHYIEVATGLRDSNEFGFSQLVDLCGVDYLQFGQAEWQTDDASRAGFSRGTGARRIRNRSKFGVSLDGRRMRRRLQESREKRIS